MKVEDVRFYVGLHQPADAHRFERACISINRLRGRKKPIPGVRVLVDSGAFTELNLYGAYRHEVDQYADELARLHREGIVQIEAAVAQDYMCEAFMLAKTEATNIALGAFAYGPAPASALIAVHQQLTIERYDALKKALDDRFDGRCPFPVLPVLQGYSPSDYVAHVLAYGKRLVDRMWVGVGSVCKRNGAPELIAAVLEAIADVRPDLRLHGFGVKVTALRDAVVRRLLATADSMGWSFAARKQGRDRNSWTEAKRFSDQIAGIVARVIEVDVFA